MKEKIFNFLNNIYKRITILHFIVLLELSIIVYLYAYLSLTIIYLENGFFVVNPLFEATLEFSNTVRNSMNPLEYIFYFIFLLLSIYLVIYFYKLCRRKL